MGKGGITLFLIRKAGGYVMKIAYPIVGPVACIAAILFAAPAAMADNSAARSSGSLSAAARGQVASEIIKKPVQTTPVASLTWYHLIETPVYTMAASQPWVVAFDLVKQKPYARLEPESYISLSISKVDTAARTYFVDCVVAADKPGTVVTSFTRNSTSPDKSADLSQAPKLINGVEHVSFVLSKPKAATFVDLIFRSTQGDFYVYQCDIAMVL